LEINEDKGSGILCCIRRNGETSIDGSQTSEHVVYGSEESQLEGDVETETSAASILIATLVERCDKNLNMGTEYECEERIDLEIPHSTQTRTSVLPPQLTISYREKIAPIAFTNFALLIPNY
jgi:hypothetical protein